MDLYDNKALKLILALFIFIVVVVLLNVLIAIVSKSHDDITGKIAAGLFYRSRLEYITEVLGSELAAFCKRARGNLTDAHRTQAAAGTGESIQDVSGEANAAAAGDAADQ
mgnify:CR=1 FL=1